MPQVSKRLVSKDLDFRIQNTLWDALAYVKDEDSVKKFLEDLLTPTEKIMLSKRLAIAVLLVKNYDYRSISQVLKVSTTTIASVATWLKIAGTGYRHVIEHILKEEKWVRILDLIDEILYEVLPSPKGKRVFGPKGPRTPIISKNI